MTAWRIPRGFPRGRCNTTPAARDRAVPAGRTWSDPPRGCPENFRSRCRRSGCCRCRARDRHRRAALRRGGGRYRPVGSAGSAPRDRPTPAMRDTAPNVQTCVGNRYPAACAQVVARACSLGTGPAPSQRPNAADRSPSRPQGFAGCARTSPCLAARRRSGRRGVPRHLRVRASENSARKVWLGGWYQGRSGRGVCAP